MPEKSTLELSGEEFQALALQALQYIAQFIDSLPHRPAYTPAPAMCKLSENYEAMPEKAAAYDGLLDRIFNDFLASGLENAGPGNMAYIPGGGLPQAAIADMIGAALNRYMPVWALSPALADIEAQVLRWFAEMIGFPAAARGILTSGSSLATFSAVLAARKKHLGEDLAKGTCYTSDIAHYSIDKAVMMAGLPASSLREIPTDAHFRMQAETLRQRIQLDKHAGLRPFMIAATAGATRTGTVDDLAAIAEVAREENVWLHIDAAYGGFFMLTERGKTALSGIEQADSVALDPHKSLFLPYGTGVLLVRNGTALRDAHQNTRQRYSDRQDNPDAIDFCEYSPELSREWRALRVWLPLKMHGIDAFRTALDEKLDLAQEAEKKLRAIPGIEIVAPTTLSIVTFRYVRAGLTPAETDALNHRLLDAVNASRKIHIMGVTLRERFVLRLCILSFRTHGEMVTSFIASLMQEIACLV